MIRSKIGIEAEFFLVNSKDEVVIPPSTWDRDDFPILGEIRGEPGEKMPDIISNFIKRKMEIEAAVSKGSRITFENSRVIKLDTYRKAMKEVKEKHGDKDHALADVRNIYGTDITDYSDQIIGANKKIQGINSSCGLHIHFSCEEKVDYEVAIPRYEAVDLPLTFDGTGLKSILSLSRRVEDKVQKTITVRASRITQPVIEWIVKRMDDEWFNKFAPPKEKRTKYRQPGFYELKPYGFEYRSLPANDEVMAVLPKITEFALDLLHQLNPK